MKLFVTNRMLQKAVEETIMPIVEENLTLKMAIEQIYTAQVYENRNLLNGISIELITAIRKAAVVAGLTKGL